MRARREIVGQIAGGAAVQGVEVDGVEREVDEDGGRVFWGEDQVRVGLESESAGFAAQA